MMRTHIRPVVAGEDGQPCTIAYRVETPRRTVTGLLAMIDGMATGGVTLLPHEQTYPHAVSALRQRLRCGQAYHEPVMLLAPAQANWNVVTTKSPSWGRCAALHHDGADAHSLHVLEDPAVQANVARYLANTSYLMIADGHHRIAALREVNAGSSGGLPVLLPAVIFSADELILEGFVLDVRVKRREAEQVLAALQGAPEFRPAPDGSMVDRLPHYRIDFAGASTTYVPAFRAAPSLAAMHREMRGWLSARVPGGTLVPVPEGGELKGCMSIHVDAGPSALVEVLASARDNVLMPQKVTCFRPKPVASLVENFLRIREPMLQGTAHQR